MQDHELRILRRELAPRARGPGLHYPDELRGRIARWARRQLEDGASLGALASALGVHRETLRRWTAGAARPPTGAARPLALVPVEVVVDEPPAGTLSVVSPAGFRIDGLTLDEAIAALSRLR